MPPPPPEKPCTYHGPIQPQCEGTKRIKLQDGELDSDSAFYARLFTGAKSGSGSGPTTGLKYSLPRAREPLLARLVLLKDGGRNNFPIINQLFFLFSSFVCVTVLCRKAAVRTYSAAKAE